MTASASSIETFLRRVDGDFPVPLSQKQNLSAFACKLAERATVCAVYAENRILSMVAGYTDHLTTGMAYVSVVATIPEARGHGFAEKMMQEFLGICVQKQLPAVHLYTAASNQAALAMYRKLGFLIWTCPDEPRPEDIHLIKYL